MFSLLGLDAALASEDIWHCFSSFLQVWSENVEYLCYGGIRSKYKTKLDKKVDDN